MKFSVVIALYNKAPYIKNALESALAQTFKDLEVIVVDDGSTDDGAELVAGMGDPRLRLVRQSNAGVSAARNRGITLARGEWVTFLDADDWHHPRYLAALSFAQSLHPKADVVATRYLPLPHADEAWPPVWRVPETAPDVELIDDLPKRWMEAPSLFTSSIAVRSTRLRQMQPCFALGESYGEDLDLWFRLAEHSPIALVRAPFAAYRISAEGSLSHNNPKFILPPSLKRMRERALSGAMSASQRRSSLKLVAHHEITMAREALEYGRRLKAAHLLLRGYHAAGTLRWWWTATMMVFFPRHLARQWQLWRVRRAGPTMTAG